MCAYSIPLCGRVSAYISVLSIAYWCAWSVVDWNCGDVMCDHVCVCVCLSLLSAVVRVRSWSTGGAARVLAWLWLTFLTHMTGCVS